MNEFKNILFANCSCVLSYKIINFINYYSNNNFIYNKNNNFIYNYNEEDYITFKDIKPQLIKRNNNVIQHYKKDYEKHYVNIINNNQDSEDNDFDFEIIHTRKIM